MKMTPDLPDDLLREVKLRAVHEGKKLKDLTAEILRRGLAAPASTPTAPPMRHRVQLPIVAAPPNAPLFDLTAERIHELEMESERERP